MINIPWTIYRENLKIQYSNQWELLLFDNEASMGSNNPSSIISRILPSSSGIANLINGSISIPQTRIKKLSFPTPFPEFDVTPLPNKMNVYNECKYDNRSVSITFTEDTNFTVYTYFYNWFKQVYNPVLRMFKPEAETVYKYASIVFKKKDIMNGTITEKPSMRFNLYKLKFKSFDGTMDLDYEDAKPIEFTVQMTVDRVDSEIFK